MNAGPDNFDSMLIPSHLRGRTVDFGFWLLTLSPRLSDVIAKLDTLLHVGDILKYVFSWTGQENAA